MSINHYTSDWWSSSNSAATPLHLNHAAAAACSQSTAFYFSNNNTGNEEDQLQEETNSSTASQVDEIPKEPLFEKSLTPSDVGKLNRLVIPKQHAEKYLPLNTAGGGGDTGAEKGLLLTFEDEIGKQWRFRYSYWNSSQSYVLTRGWSRFVKEKRLDAGDAVLFLRHREDVGRLFIGWRLRNSAAGGQQSGAIVNARNNTPPAAAAAGGGGGGGWSGVVYNNNAGHSYLISQYHQEYSSSTPYYHQPPPDHDHCLHAGSVVEKQTRATSGNLKRLRLFGVNLDQWEESEPSSSPDGSATSSHGQTHHHPYHH